MRRIALLQKNRACYSRNVILFSRLFAAIPLLLTTSTPMREVPAEKTWNGSDEAIIWVVSKKPRVKIETHRGFTFHLDFAAHGALSLAHVCESLHTEPKGLTLSFNPSDGLLSVDYDRDAKELRVLLRGSSKPLCKVSLQLAQPATRVLLRQRNQLALYAISQDGSHTTLVWLGTLGYVIQFRNAAQYELCRDLKIAMGRREVSFNDFRQGIKMEALDEIADVTVSGTSPGGVQFIHSYTFDYPAVEKLLDMAFTIFLRVAGNEPIAGKDAKPAPTPNETQ